MTQTPTLFDTDRIAARFAEFDQRQPEVYQAFKRLATERLNAGWAHYSADAIAHAVRWTLDVNPERDSDFKVNNNYVRPMAERLATEDARFRTFFRFRHREQP